MSVSSTHPARRVLVIDDDASARRMMRRALERAGYEVLDAADGRSGFELMRVELPDVVLLDLRMPGELSGTDVLELARRTLETRELRIAVVTASAHSEARDQLDSLGCDAFVEKPVSFDELFAVVARLAQRD